MEDWCPDPCRAGILWTLNWESFCRAWGRSNMHGVQHGAFRRDSVKDFASRPCWHRRALRAIVWKMWLSFPKGKVAVENSLHTSLTFNSWGWHIPSPPYVQAAFPIESTWLLQLPPNPGESILSMESCQSLVRSKFSLCSCKISLCS